MALLTYMYMEDLNFVIIAAADASNGARLSAGTVLPKYSAQS